MSGLWDALKRALGLEGKTPDQSDDDVSVRNASGGPDPEPLQDEDPIAREVEPMVLAVGVHADLEDPSRDLDALADALERGVKAMGLEADILIRRTDTPIFETGVTLQADGSTTYQDSLIAVFKRENAHAVVCANERDEDGRLIFSLTPTLYLADFLAPMTNSEFILSMPLGQHDSKILMAYMIGACMPVIRGNHAIRLDICRDALSAMEAAINAEETDFENWSQTYLVLQRAYLATQYGKIVGDLDLLERSYADYVDVLAQAEVHGPVADRFNLDVRLGHADTLEVLGRVKNDMDMWREALVITREAYDTVRDELGSYQRRDLESLHLELLISLGQRDAHEPTLREAVDVAREALGVIDISYEPLAWANAAIWLSRALNVLFGHTYAHPHLNEAEKTLDTALEALADREGVQALRLSLLRQLGIVRKARSGLTRNSDDMRSAITAFEAMLDLLPDGKPKQTVAQIQLEIGEMYLNQLEIRVEGDGLDRAIAHLEHASTHLDRGEDALLWADAQFSMGNASAFRGWTQASGRDLDRAIHHFGLAMQVFTQDDYRDVWIDLQARLGRALRDRAQLSCDLSDLSRASKALKLALDATPADKAPRQRADIAHDLGGVEAWRAENDQNSDMMKTALGYIEIALSHRTRDRDLQAWTNTHILKLDATNLLSRWSKDPDLITAALGDAITLIEVVEAHQASPNPGWTLERSLEGFHAVAGDLARRLGNEFGQDGRREEAMAHYLAARALVAETGDTERLELLDKAITETRRPR